MSTIGPGSRAEPALQEARGVAVGDEADVVAVRLVGDGQPAGLGLAAHLRPWRVSPSGNIACADLARGQDAEDVGLVLGLVDGAVQPAVLTTRA